MQPCNSNHTDTKTTFIDRFKSWKTGSIVEAWSKGQAFGFRDCQIWYGIRLTDFDAPTDNTRKSPLSGRYVCMSQCSKKQMTEAKAELEHVFKSDFREIRRSDQLDSSAVLNRILAYDLFMNLAVQDMPDDKTIPEFIFECVPRLKKPWLENYKEIQDTLLWVAKRMMDKDKCKSGSLTLLLATWIEITNAVAMDKAPCKNPKGKPYFDWLDVFAFAGQPSPSSWLTGEVELADAGQGNKSGDVAIPESTRKEHASRTGSDERSRKLSRLSLKRKGTTVTDGQAKRQKYPPTPAGEILGKINSMEKRVNKLKASPDYQITLQERGEIAKYMLSVFRNLAGSSEKSFIPDSND